MSQLTEIIFCVCLMVITSVICVYAYRSYDPPEEEERFCELFGTIDANRKKWERDARAAKMAEILELIDKVNDIMSDRR